LRFFVLPEVQMGLAEEKQHRSCVIFLPKQVWRAANAYFRGVASTCKQHEQNDTQAMRNKQIARETVRGTIIK